MNQSEMMSTAIIFNNNHFNEPSLNFKCPKTANDETSEEAYFISSKKTFFEEHHLS